MMKSLAEKGIPQAAVRRQANCQASGANPHRRSLALQTAKLPAARPVAVVRDGVDPSTSGFSDQRSTN